MSEKENIYKVDLEKATKDKVFYALAMFPYPSGAGLHVWHGMNFTANDIMARFKRMQWYTVINPMWWDSFWLPTENYAIKLGKPANEVTEENIKNYKKQCELLDRSYDWDREVTTSSSEYYKWTQWIFAQLYKAGLVYKKDAFVNRCPDCQTVLANDQVVDWKCERCGTEVIQKKHPQRFIKITDYAEQLIDWLDTLDWPEETKTQQKYWIGKSEGAEIDFKVGEGASITVFTTRPDTLFGVTAIVLAPENTTLDSILSEDNKKILDEYRVLTGKKTAIERQQDLEEKSGVFSWVYATHPLTNENVSVWFADYVLPDYATGAVMFVPAHDERDFVFAKKHDLPVKQVILQKSIDKEKLEKLFKLHKELQEEADKLWVDIYFVWWLSIPLRTGVIYRNHNDLDYVIKTGSVDELLKKYVDEKRIGEVKQKEHWIVEYLIDWIEVEFIPTNSGDSVWMPISENDYDQKRHQLRDIIGKTYITECIEKIKKVRNDEKDQIDLQYLIQWAYTDAGVLINSWKFDWVDSNEAKSAIIAELEKQGVGRGKITYKLRDWSVSRQRYWGAPIPVYYTFEDPQYNAYNPHPDKAKWIPHLIPEEELPVVLPLDLGNYKPAGKSPLADHPTFPYYKAKDGNVYLRECDTLDTFMCSSFYFLRFVDPHNTEQLIRKDLAEKALPVDFYIGGKEHTYGHLLYSRFINRFLYDQWYISNPEPFQHLFHQGMVLGPDGRKMSKRWWNVITPGDLVEKYGHERGADVLRTYTMFMGPLELEKAWNDWAVDWVKRFLDRVERMQDFFTEESNQQTQIQLHKTIKWVTEDIEKLKFNTAVSKLMIFVNHVYDVKQITKEQYLVFLQLLAPFATKLTQELWSKIWQQDSIHLSTRPVYDETLLADDIFSLPVQINWKMRWNIEVPVGISQDDVVKLVTTNEKFAHHFATWSIKKIIYVQDKIVNFIIW